jgi:alpha-glucosidase
MLLTLRGTPFLYYGDELALPEVPLDPATALDPVPRRTGDPNRNRDRCRTPMQWTAEEGAGFTEPGVEPWLPFGDPAAHNVAAQRGDPGSQLHFVRDLIALRRWHADLRSGDYETLPAPDDVWAWRRGDGFATAINLGDAGASVEGLDGTIAIATDRARDGETVTGALRLAASEGVVVELNG